MKKPLRTVLFVLLALVVVLLVAAGAFALRFRKMTRVVRAARVEHVDLAQVPDGDYTGEFGDFLVSVKLRVKVRDHRIAAVEIIDQHSGPGYEAKEIAERIVAAQSPKVDAVTGATGSSLSIMAAAYRALTDGTAKPAAPGTGPQ